MNYIFLSYSHKDVKRVMPIFTALSQEHRVVYDTNIGAAREYNDEIAEMIDHATIMLSFVSRNYVHSSYCIDEILYARGKEIPILLVYLEETELSAGMKLRLGRFQAIDVHDAAYMDQIMNTNKVMQCFIGETASSAAEVKDEIHTVRDIEKNYYLSDLSVNQYLEEGDRRWKHQNEWSFDTVAGVEADLYSEAGQEMLIDFASKGHFLISGISFTGKSTMVQTILYALIHKYSPAEFHFYVIDMNTYMYECFAKAPHAGVIINDHSKRRIKYLLHLLGQILEERRQLIRSGDIRQYNNIHGGRLSAILLVIDNVEAVLNALNREQSDILCRIVDIGSRYGIYLLLVNNETGSFGDGEISYRQLTRTIKNRLCFEQYCGFDYGSFLDVAKTEENLPVKWCLGKGVHNLDHVFKQFKAAQPFEADNMYVREQMIEYACEAMKAVWQGPGARELQDVPDDLALEDFFSREDVKAELSKANKIPLGLNLEDAKVVSLNMDTLYSFLIVGKRGAGHQHCMRTILEAARKKNAQVFYIDQVGRESFRLEDENIHYANNVQDIFDVSMNHLVPLIRERVELRKDAEQMGMSESMILDKMKAFPPIFLMIDDLRAFSETVYRSEGSDRIRAFWEKLISKARGFNCYIFAGTTESKRLAFGDDMIPNMLLAEKEGICVGGTAADQMLLDFNLARYKELLLPMNPGEGRLCLNDNNDLIKIPR